MSREELRSEIKNLLKHADFEGLVALAKAHPSVPRLLISMTYDKADLLSWRAMEAIGRIAAGWPAERARNTIQRLLWMMREESGTNAWSAGEIISEIIRQNPSPFEDIVPIVISFHEEKILRTGSLWCMVRVGEVRPGLVEPFEDVAVGYLGSDDPQERGYALLALKALGKKEHLPAVRKMREDSASFVFYDGKALKKLPLKSIAKETASALEK